MSAFAAKVPGHTSRDYYTTPAAATTTTITTITATTTIDTNANTYTTTTTIIAAAAVILNESVTAKVAEVAVVIVRVRMQRTIVERERPPLPVKYGCTRRNPRQC